MKTVKFSLNELMSEIDESFIEEVYFHDCNKILKKYSPNYFKAPKKKAPHELITGEDLYHFA